MRNPHRSPAYEAIDRAMLEPCEHSVDDFGPGSEALDIRRNCSLCRHRLYAKLVNLGRHELAREQAAGGTDLEALPAMGPDASGPE